VSPWLRPSFLSVGVVAEVEAPRRINLGEGDAGGVEVEGLRVRQAGDKAGQR
jgi:hypothetical protein